MSQDDLYWRFRDSARISDRTVDELVGLCRGILADGSIVQAEAEFLLKWLEGHRASCMEWPIDMLFARVSAMLKDGVFDQAESEELFKLLMKFTGGGLPPDEVLSSGIVVSGSSTLPLDDPEPPVIFNDQTFCFTGELCFGPRKICQTLVQELGGIVKSGVSEQLRYLIVGSIGSMAWVHSTHGRKIQAAVDLRDQGHALAIIGEKHWIAEAGKCLGDRL